jgi:hypothetical protein
MYTYMLCSENVLASILGALSIAGECSALVRMCKKGQAITTQALRVSGVQAPRFQENRPTKVARLSTLRTGRLNPPGDIPGTNFY